jgi:penicillin-insensitive murein endopeptidase
MRYILPLFSILLLACVEKKQPVIKVVQNTKETIIDVPKSPMQKYYDKHNQDSLNSVSKGTVSNGKLNNAVLFPPKGNNYNYFAEQSYLKGRAFVNSEVKDILINALGTLEKTVPDQQFQIMEIAHEYGGELWPHRTHQKGTSVDFMLPKMKADEVDYSLDQKGISHYFLNSDDNGVYDKSGGVSINFERTAKEILALNEAALLNGWEIKKVIFKVELLDELFKTNSGEKLKKQKVYFAKSLTKKVNEAHDDHFHVDFEKK